jgi:hypothetical protein
VETTTRNQFSAPLVLILGIVGLMSPIFPGMQVCSLLAILGSHVAPLVLKPTRTKGQWTILSGAILGYIGVGLLYGLDFYQPWIGDRQRAEAIAVYNSLGAIGNACRSFSLDHDGMLPVSIEELSEKGYLDTKYLRNPSIPERKCGFRMVAGGRLVERGSDEVLATEVIYDAKRYFLIVLCSGDVLLMKGNELSPGELLSNVVDEGLLNISSSPVIWKNTGEQRSPVSGTGP